MLQNDAVMTGPKAGLRPTPLDLLTASLKDTASLSGALKMVKMLLFKQKFRTKIADVDCDVSWLT